MIPKMHTLSEDAKKLGTINTAVRKAEGWTGYPRDSEGLIRGYPFLSNARSVAIIGSGGVVPSVIHACQQSGIEVIHVFARNDDARIKLGKIFGVETHELDVLAAYACEILICAVNADISLVIPEALDGAQAIDLRYGKETEFLSDAKDAGYTVHDGLPMLLHQALAQFELFTGLKTTEDDEKLLTDLLHLPT